jgi:TP901 family phage tail tape measure protein
MFESWSVGIIFRATSNVAAVMAQTRASTTGANTAIARQNALLERQQRILRSRAMVAGGVALGGAFIIGAGIKNAADLQNSMVAVEIATKGATGHMAQFYQLAYKVSGLTAQSASTIGRELAVAASSGLGSLGRAQLSEAFTRIAKAADVMWLSPKHTDPVTSVAQMSQLSHLFGAYSGAKLQHMLDRAVQMQYVQPEDFSRMVTQGRMFIGPALSRGVTEDDIFKQAMTMGQTGFLRSRGGSGLARVIEYLSGAATMTGHLSKIQHRALSTLGMTNSQGILEYQDKKGNLLLGKAIDHLEAIRKNFTPTAFGNLLTNAFLAQGGRYMATILMPNVYAQVQKNWAQMNRIGNVDSMWKKYSDTFKFAWSQFTTNLQNVLGATFLPLLPAFTVALKSAAKELGIWTQWLMKNPKMAATIAIAAFSAVAMSAIYAATNMWKLNASILAVGVSAGFGGGGFGPAGRRAARAAHLAQPSMWGKIIGGFWGSLSFLTFGLSGLAKSLFSKWNTLLPAGIDLLTNKLIMPTLQAVNRLGPIGTRIVGFFLRLQNPMTLLGDVFKALFRSMAGVDLEVIASGITRLGAALSGLLGIVGRILGGAIGPFLFTQGGLFAPTPVGQDRPFWKVDQWLQYVQRHGHAPGSNAPNINVNNPVFQMTPGTDPKKHAREFLDEVMRHARGGSAAHGASHPVHPFFDANALPAY